MSDFFQYYIDDYENISSINNDNKILYSYTDSNILSIVKFTNGYIVIKCNKEIYSDMKQFIYNYCDDVFCDDALH